MMLIASALSLPLSTTSLIFKMAFFENGLRAKVMSTEIILEADLSKKILFEALDLVKEFEAKFSAYKEDSLLNRVNINAGISGVICTQDERELFSKALEMAKASDGVFDPTIGILSQATYCFGKSTQKIPTKKELQKAKELVNFKDFIVNKESVYLKRKGMRLDFGGIGKGFIAEKLITYLRNKGAKKALVNAGGEICTFGKNYNIAIKSPYTDENIAVVKTSKAPITFSTSGDYERFISSKENHHILDIKTASQNHYYSSITLIKDGKDGTLLDAVATMAFNTPKEKLRALAKRYNIAIIAIEEEGNLLFENFKSLDIKAIELYAL